MLVCYLIMSYVYVMYFGYLLLQFPQNPSSQQTPFLHLCFVSVCVHMSVYMCVRECELLCRYMFGG